MILGSIRRAKDCPTRVVDHVIPLAAPALLQLHFLTGMTAL